MPESDTDADSGDDDNVQMNFLASQSQRERWEEYAEEMGFRNLSGLFRFAIEKEVKGEGDGGSGGGAPENVTEQLSEVVEGINRVESRLHDLDNRLATVENEVRDDPGVKKLANEVFGVLPTEEEVIDFAKAVEQGGSQPDSPATAGTIEGIATELDEDEYRVAEALDQLQHDTHQVNTMTLAETVEGWTSMYGEGDETRYYKEG